MLMLTAGAQSAYWVARWRQAVLNPTADVPQHVPETQLTGIDRLSQRLNAGRLLRFHEPLQALK